MGRLVSAEAPLIIKGLTSRWAAHTRWDLDALLAAWRPGAEGGGALANLLLGEANPSGKLVSCQYFLELIALAVPLTETHRHSRHRTG